MIRRFRCVHAYALAKNGEVGVGVNNRKRVDYR